MFKNLLKLFIFCLIFKSESSQYIDAYGNLKKEINNDFYFNALVQNCILKYEDRIQDFETAFQQNNDNIFIQITLDKKNYDLNLLDWYSYLEDIQMMEYIIYKYEDHFKGNKSNIALWICMKFGLYELADKLFAKGARCDFKDRLCLYYIQESTNNLDLLIKFAIAENGQSIFDYAFSQSNIVLLNIIKNRTYFYDIESGVLFNFYTAISILFKCINNNEIGLLYKYLIFLDVNLSRDLYLAEALFECAIFKENITAIKVLIYFGLDINMLNQIGSVVWMKSIIFKKTELFQKLLNLGVNINIVDKSYNNILDIFFAYLGKQNFNSDNIKDICSAIPVIYFILDNNLNEEYVKATLYKNKNKYPRLINKVSLYKESLYFLYDRNRSKAIKRKVFYI